ncbi:peroxide stress protein YaaA [uncultured Shimia sp.]|uniref:peroxide stress protein YaaA n=1 Tax=uncultured Shimia sp. TaxID=573152 RepID=UPI0026247ED4|nr:peroxide stress protein YaaA [uncultured Shimia sp.]
MLVVVSPAKRLDWSPVAGNTSQPEFADEALKLAKTARYLTLGDLQKLMSLSPDLAKLNRDRFKAYESEPDQFATRPAVHAFNGDTYIGLEAASLDGDEMAWAQEHLRILSGLYGILRPMDAIQAYRLEMGSRLKTRRGKNLYEFWRDSIAKNLNEQASQLGTDTLVNCASQEYFGAVDPKALKLRVITPVFMEDKGGTAKIVSFFAKKARGSMARYIIQRRLTDPEGLKDFDLGGYTYKPDMSEGDKLVFLRDYPDAKT